MLRLVIWSLCDAGELVTFIQKGESTVGLYSPAAGQRNQGGQAPGRPPEHTPQ